MSNSKDTFNMKDLSVALANNFNLTAKQGAEMARFVFDEVKSQVLAGKQVRLHHFGTLEAHLRQAGVARNPQNGERLVVPPRRVLKLTVASSLKADLAKTVSKQSH